MERAEQKLDRDGAPSDEQMSYCSISLHTPLSSDRNLIFTDVIFSVKFSVFQGLKLTCNVTPYFRTLISIKPLSCLASLVLHAVMSIFRTCTVQALQ